MATDGSSGGAPPREAQSGGMPPPPADRNVELIFVIFQGGGAKGMTHVGALKALEEENLLPYGVAGTSAGAIVAALVAVGYSADELLNPVPPPSSILRGVSPIEHLGRAAWSRLQWIRGLALPLALVAAASLLLLLVALGWTLLGPVWPAIGAAPPWLVVGASLALLAAAVTALVLVASLLWRGGLFDSAGLRKLVNEKLRDKLREHYRTNGLTREPPELVTFADIDPVTVTQCRALKVVATDVSGHRLVLFDAATPGVVVADAVVASAAIPLAFPPPVVRGWTRRIGTVFADGGLVSNLPAWVFTVEKRALERQQQGAAVRTIAFTLKPPPVRQGAIITRIGPEAPAPLRVGDLAMRVNGMEIAGFATLARLVAAVPPGERVVLDIVRDGQPRRIDLGAVPAGSAGFGRLGVTAIPTTLGGRVARRSLLTYLIDVVETGIFGSQTIVEQFVPDLEVIELPTTLTTLGFDCGWSGASAAHRCGQDTALTVLRRQRMIREETRRQLTGILKVLEDEVKALWPGRSLPTLRLYLVDPDGPPDRENSEYRVTATAGISRAADDRLSLDPGNPAAPAAFRERKPVVAVIAGATARELWMTRYEHALLPPTLCSIIAVPVFGRPVVSGPKPPPQRALCLDSDGDLRPMFAHPTFMQTLLDLSQATARAQIADEVDRKGTSDG